MKRWKRILLVLLSLPVSCVMLWAGACVASMIEIRSQAARENDGSSLAEAIVIEAEDEFDGVNQEYAWIAGLHPFDTIVSQGVMPGGETVYDVFELETNGGERYTMYFDITGFYGKW